MAALGRQILDRHRLIPLTWACLARRTSHFGEQKRRPTSLFRKLTTSNSGGSLEEVSCVGPKKYVLEPECRTSLDRCLPEQKRTCVEGVSWEPEDLIGSLRDVGFSDAHVTDLLSIQPSVSPQQLLNIVSELILLGLSPEPVCVALKKNPQLLKLSVMQMRRHSSYLRRLGLGEGKLEQLLHGCPEVFSMRRQDIDAVIRVLKEKCLFTVQQVTEILHRCPRVLRQSPRELEYQFQYAHFRMGMKHRDIVKTEFLQHSMTKIKQRHIYLERLGRYQTPDKKGQTQIANPLLRDVLSTSEAEFLARIACSSAEEFEVFKKLLAREEASEEESATSDEEDEEEEKWL